MLRFFSNACNLKQNPQCEFEFKIFTLSGKKQNRNDTKKLKEWKVITTIINNNIINSRIYSHQDYFDT